MGDAELEKITYQWSSGGDRPRRGGVVRFWAVLGSAWAWRGGVRIWAVVASSGLGGEANLRRR